MELTDKYRPISFDQVLGQEAVVKSLSSLIDKEKKLPPCLLFSGAPGLGKTTLARLCAKAVGCSKENLIELNGAISNSVDDFRQIVDVMNYQPFGPSKSRVIIIDECQRLSKQAWDSILKPTEEPSPNSTWIFCSTEPAKIPPAILSRCTPPNGFQLKKVSATQLKGLLTEVVTAEGFKTPASILQLIIMRCDGSPRRALKYLQALHNVTTVNEAQDLIKSLSASEAGPVLELCRLIANRGQWSDAVKIIKDFEDDAESLRISVVRYFSTIVTRATEMEQIQFAMMVLHAFRGPFERTDGIAPILLALATMLLPD